MRCSLSTPGSRRMCFSLVTFTCRWFTTTGFTSVVYRTSLSGRTTCRSCVHCCHCQWACCQLGWCRQTLPVPGCCVWMILRKFSVDQLERRDVLIGEEDHCAWRSRLLSPFEFTIQDLLAAAGAVVLDCPPPPPVAAGLYGH